MREETMGWGGWGGMVRSDAEPSRTATNTAAVVIIDVRTNTIPPPPSFSDTRRKICELAEYAFVGNIVGGEEGRDMERTQWEMLATPLAKKE